MAREKIADKEKAIIEAAIAVFAERGFWNTPTSLISKTAGVADGTLFTYFATKDDLIHAVYLAVKGELADELMAGFDTLPTLYEKMRHIWSHFIEWGVAHPERFRVMQQIKSNYAISPDVAAQGLEPFAAIDQIARESIASGLVHDYPVDYLGALMDSQSSMTVEFITTHPEGIHYYIDIGFEILWKGVTR
ncbi:MAG: TetR/AcrR family transcriptional regulator [Anaerolineae bacterium]|nr:TetR/AcrR family transcriptional regulator [Anaerolineae bacterium]